MHTEPTKEHQWIKRYLGDWTYSSECAMEPGGTPQKFEGRETFRPIGDLWVQGEARGPMPGGGEAVMVTTVGFNPATGKFVGSWIGSMMAHMWVYEGWLEDDDTLVFETSGPRMDDPSKTALYRETARFEGDSRVFRSTIQQDDGSWKEIMSMTFRRAT